MSEDRQDPVVAELERLGDLDDTLLLGHVQAQHLVAFAERRAAGPAKAFVEQHLEGCELCRDALQRLEATATVRSEGNQRAPLDHRTRFWEFLRRTVLAPAPALAYLLLLATGLAWWGTRPPADAVPDPLPTTVPLFAADTLRGSATDDVPVVVPWTADSAVVLVMHTDILPGEVDGGLTVRVTADGAVIVDRVVGADRILDDGVLSVIVPAHEVRPGAVYRVRVEGPGALPFAAAFRFHDRP